jgi:anti-sigma-K factor RskA
MNSKNDTFEQVEDRLVEDLLERFNDSPVPESGSADPESEALLREYVEALGLMPFELEPEIPSASVKRSIMEAVEGGRPVVESDEELAAVVQMPTAGWRRWALPLAAGLALAFLGYSGWQYFHLEQQRGTIERLADQLSEANKQAVQLVDYQHELERAQNKLALVASHGVEICPLQPMGTAQAIGAPHGTLFVAADHQNWYLHVDDLEPCPEGRAYQLWFIRSDGSTDSGGILEAKSGVCLEVISDKMPAGTIAISVTLEPAGGSSAPSGPQVLYGDELTRIL